MSPIPTLDIPDLGPLSLPPWEAQQHGGDGGRAISLRELGAITPIIGIASLLVSGWTDQSPAGSFYYRQGHVVHMEGAIGTPTTPSANAVILTLPLDFRPAVTQVFELFDPTAGAAYIRAVAEAESAGHGGEIQWISGAHGAGVKLSLARVSFLDPWRKS